MANSDERSEIVESNFEWFQILGRLGVVAAGYPLDYVKVLIQVRSVKYLLKEVFTFSNIVKCESIEDV